MEALLVYEMTGLPAVVSASDVDWPLAIFPQLSTVRIVVVAVVVDVDVALVVGVDVAVVVGVDVAVVVGVDVAVVVGVNVAVVIGVDVAVVVGVDVAVVVGEDVAVVVVVVVITWHGVAGSLSSSVVPRGQKNLEQAPKDPRGT